MNLEFEVDLPKRDKEKNDLADLCSEIEELKKGASELEERIKRFGSIMPEEDKIRLRSLLYDTLELLFKKQVKYRQATTQETGQAAPL